MDINIKPRKRGRPSLDIAQPVDHDKCLRQALEVFAELGYEGTSVRELARRLNISHGLLNARFGSKRELWEAAFDRGMSRLLQHMAGLDQPSDPDASTTIQFHQACMNFLVGLMESPAIIKIMNIEGTRKTDRLAHVVDKFFRDEIWPFDVLLRKGQAEGVFWPIHPAVPFTMLAHGAGALIALRPLIELVDEELEVGSDGIMRLAEQATDIILRGILDDTEKYSEETNA